MTKETPQTDIERLESENSELREENESNSRCAVTPAIITNEVRRDIGAMKPQSPEFTKLETLLDGSTRFRKETSFGAVVAEKIPLVEIDGCYIRNYIYVKVRSPEPRNVWHTFGVDNTGIILAEKRDYDDPLKKDPEFTFEQLLSEL